jgi:hypothetical protein
MNRIHLAMLSALATLAGCQAPYPNTDFARYGATVRTTLASEVIPPQAYAAPGTDGVAATAAYTNYQRSYVTPTAQADSPTFGGK